MTDTIERLRQLLAKATPGPWDTMRAHNAVTEWPMVVSQAESGTKPVAETFGDKEANAALIVAMHKALPALLADLTRLQALERRWEEAPVCIVGDECQLWGGPDSLDDYIGKSVRLVREE